MATKTIGTSARQYATIALWESYLDGGGNSGSAGVLGEAEIGECYNDSEFDESVDFSGYTTSATNTVTLRPATGQGFRDAATKRLAYDQSKGVAWKRGGFSFAQTCTIQVDYFTLFGMQLKGTSAYINYTVYVVGSTFGGGSLANTKVDSCILNHTFRPYCANMRSGKLINCLMYNDTTGTSVAVDMPTFQTVDVYGCTIARTSNNTPVGTALGDGGGYGRVGTIKNCAIFGFTTTWGPDTTWTSQSYCATDQASFPAAVTGGVTSLTFTSQFVSSSNVSTDFIALSSGGLKAGTPDATNTPVDIFGTTRDATTPYIGCYEVPGGGFTPYAATLTAAVFAMTPQPLVRLTTVANVLTAANFQFTGKPLTRLTTVVQQLTAAVFAMTPQPLVRMVSWATTLTAAVFAMTPQPITRINAYAAQLTAASFRFSGQAVTWFVSGVASVSEWIQRVRRKGRR